MSRFLLRAFPVAVAAGIFILSHQPSLPSIPLFPYQDKVFHFLEFSLLVFSLLLNRDLFRKKCWTSVIICAGIWAIIDEVHQSFIPGRSCSLFDFAADYLGIIVTVLIFWRVLSRRRCQDI